MKTHLLVMMVAMGACGGGTHADSDAAAPDAASADATAFDAAPIDDGQFAACVPYDTELGAFPLTEDQAAHALFVAPGGGSVDDGCGTVAAPCDLEDVHLAFDATHHTVYVEPGSYAPANEVDLEASGMLTVCGAGSDLSIIDGEDTLPADFELVNTKLSSLTLNGFAITCDSGKLELDRIVQTGAFDDNGVSGPCDVTLTDSSIEYNYEVGIAALSAHITRSIIAHNHKGGAYLGAGSDVRDSIFLDNGAEAGEYTPRALDVGEGSTVEFDTFAFNGDVGGDNGEMDDALYCEGGGNVVDSNIVWDNEVITAQTNCVDVTYSLIGPTALAGTGNLSADPQFVSSTDLHLGATSPAIDTAAPDATEAVDVDGDARPSDGGYDMGADER